MNVSTRARPRKGTSTDSDQGPVETSTIVHSADGTAIFVEVSGSGAPVVLICGALTTRSVHRPLASLLAERFTVFNHDRRGRGKSGDTAPYAVEREVEDLRAVIDLAGGSASVFGSVSGAMLALQACASGARMTHMVLWEPPVVRPDPRQPKPPDRNALIDNLVARGQRGDVIEHFLTEVVGLSVAAIAPMRHLPLWANLEALAPTIAYDAALSGGGRIPFEILPGFGVPTLVLDGGSRAGLSDGADALAAALPSGHRLTLTGQCHDFDAHVLALILTTFLSEEGPT